MFLDSGRKEGFCLSGHKMSGDIFVPVVGGGGWVGETRDATGF